MKIYSPQQYYNPCSFGTNARSYNNEAGDYRCTMTQMFRKGLDWTKFTDYMVKHFRNKDKVNFIQFAASDGSEAYTQIITLLENHPNTNKFFPIQAYDIDEEIIQAAKSGRINANHFDFSYADENGIILNKYLKKADNELLINNDSFELYICDEPKLQTKSYVVSDKVTSKVDFHQADMNNILRNLEDNSNTVIMCRNVLGYLTEREVDNFTDTLSGKLKKDSLFIVGIFDNSIHKDLDLKLCHKGFVPVMENVYRKA